MSMRTMSRQTVISAADNQNWISGDVTRNGNTAAEARYTIHTLF